MKKSKINWLELVVIFAMGLIIGVLLGDNTGDLVPWLLGAFACLMLISMWLLKKERREIKKEEDDV